MTGTDNSQLPERRKERPNWRKPREDALKALISEAKMLVTTVKGEISNFESTLLQRAGGTPASDIERRRLTLGRLKMSLGHLDSIVKEIEHYGEIRFLPIERYTTKLENEIRSVRGYVTTLAGAKSNLFAKKDPHEGEFY